MSTSNPEVSKTCGDYLRAPVVSVLSDFRYQNSWSPAIELRETGRKVFLPVQFLFEFSFPWNIHLKRIEWWPYTAQIHSLKRWKFLLR